MMARSALFVKGEEGGGGGCVCVCVCVGGGGLLYFLICSMLKKDKCFS